MQLRACASLYLASNLESAGLVQAAEDFVALVRTGAIPGDLGEAAPLVDTFWKARRKRISEAERMALFGRLFGTPGGPQDMQGGSNGEFDKRLLDLCDAIMRAVEGGSQGRVRSEGARLAENIAGAASEMVVNRARPGSRVGTCQARCNAGRQLQGHDNAPDEPNRREDSGDQEGRVKHGAAGPSSTRSLAIVR